jgi:hypothetical protein
MAQRWDRIMPGPDEAEQPQPGDYVSYVSLGIVGYDPVDPSLAFVRREGGQVLVEVHCMDGKDVNAYLCHQQTGPNAGDYTPVGPGESVVLLWPDGDSEPYIIARVADLERQLVNQVCGVDTATPLGQLELVRQFRWMRTVDGQVFAIQAGGEMLLQGGGAGVRISGAQVVVDGAVHLGADFTSNPEPGLVVGNDEPVHIPAVPFIPVPDISLSLEPQPPQLRDGIARFQDPIEANILTDDAFFEYWLAVYTFISAAALILGIPWSFTEAPAKLTSRLVRASTKHTAVDGP